MPLPAVRPAPAGLPPTRCPDCGGSLAHVGVDDVVRCDCRGDVGAAFNDVHGQRLKVRAVFSTTTEQACAACGGARHRVLIGTDVGVACDGCGVVVRRERPDHATPDRRFSRAGLVGEVVLVVVIVSGVVAGLIAWLWPLTAG